MCIYCVLLCVVCVHGGEEHQEGWWNSFKVIFSAWSLLRFKTEFEGIYSVGSGER